MHIHQILPGPQEPSTGPDASGKMRNREYRPGIQARDVRRAFLHFLSWVLLMEKCPLKRSSGDMATKQHTEENCKSPFKADLPSSGHICQPGGQRGCWRPCSQKTPSGGSGEWKKLSSKQSCDDLLIQCTKRASTSIPGRLELCTGRSEEQVFRTISPGSCGTCSGLPRLMLLLGWPHAWKHFHQVETGGKNR